MNVFSSHPFNENRASSITNTIASSMRKHNEEQNIGKKIIPIKTLGFSKESNESQTSPYKLYDTSVVC